MKVTIVDHRALESLPPLDVAAYLRLRGWQGEAYGNFEARVWKTLSPDHVPLAAIQPLVKDFGDYAARMGEVLQALECKEQRSQLAIYSDIMTVNTDVVRIAVHSDETSVGSISLDEGADLVSAARNLVLAAACSATAPRAAWLRRRPEQAAEYLRRTRFGQTEQGSFVLRILSRVPPTYDLGLEDPYERKVTRMLAEGLTEARLLAQEGGDVAGQEPRLRASVQKGVSYNLCESVAMLGSGGCEQEVHVSISWAPTRATTGSIPSSFRFSPDTCDYVRAVGRILRRIAPQDDFEVEGHVVRLDQSGRAERITVRAPVDGILKHIRMDLPEEMRKTAIDAYDQRCLIHCEGELVSAGVGFRLDHVRSFGALPSEDEAP